MAYGHSNKRKVLNVVTGIFIAVIIFAIAGGVLYVRFKDKKPLPPENKHGFDLNIKVENPDGLENVFCYEEIINAEKKNNSEFKNESKYRSIKNLWPSYNIKGIYFKDVEQEEVAEEIKEVIIYLNIKNGENVPIAIETSFDSNLSGNILCESEQLPYVQEKLVDASVDDIKEQSVKIKIRYNNPDIVESLMESVNLNVKITALPQVPDTSFPVEKYEIDNLTGGVVVKGITGQTTIKIPREINGIPVTKIADEAFKNNTALKNLYLPDTLLEIGNSAFHSSGIENIVIPDSVKSIGDRAFQASSIKSVVLPKDLKKLNFGIFQNCRSLEKVVLPENFEYIGDSVFNHCEKLKNEVIELPETIKQIGGKTYDPEKPDTKVVGTMIFYNVGIANLKEFKISSRNKDFITIDGVLYRKDNNGQPCCLIAYPAAKTDEVYEMPDTVTDAFELSFSRAYYLHEVKIGNGFVVKNMQSNHVNFAEMNNLTGAIYIYTNVTRITCKDDNPRYLSYNGQLYSKDGKILYAASVLSTNNPKIESENNEVTTLKFKPGVEKFYHGALFGSSTNIVAVSGIQFDQSLYRKRYTKIEISNSIKSVCGENIHKDSNGEALGVEYCNLYWINKYFTNNIVLHESNQFFTIGSNGKLKEKTN